MYKTKPDLSHLRIFKSLVNVKTSAKRYMKLDTISNQGLFMTYSRTHKNVYVVNYDSTNEQLTTHLSYDKAHMSSLQKELPPMAIALQQHGCYNQPNSTRITFPDKLKINLLSNNAILPIKATPYSAGYNIYSAESVIIPASSQNLICTNVSIEIPPDHFRLLKSHSGLTMLWVQ